MSPALPPTCSRASLMPFTTAVVCARAAPCSGNDEYMVTDFALSPPPPPPPPESSSPPQAATPNASAAARQPEAANEREIKEPLLIGIVVGRRFYARPSRQGNSVPRGEAEAECAAHRLVRRFRGL